jgi:hypothetical protein
MQRTSGAFKRLFLKLENQNLVIWAFWNSLRQFGLFCGHLAFFCIGML